MCFFVEQSWGELSLARHNTPIMFNSTGLSGNNTQEMITLSSVASPEPQILTIDSDSNESTMPYGFGRQLMNIPPSLNALNLPQNPFNILATMVIAKPTTRGHDENYSPQSPEPSDPSQISTSAMNFSTNKGWETPHTTTDGNTFYSDDEPTRIYFLTFPPSRLHPASWMENWALECPFQKDGECRSTSAKPADRRSLNQRTF